MAYEHPITLDRLENGGVVRWYEGRDMRSRKRYVPTPQALATLVFAIWEQRTIPDESDEEPVVAAGDAFDGIESPPNPLLDAIVERATAPQGEHAVGHDDTRET
jgi:hypothetical protein